MKQKILEGLRTKYLGVSDSILNRIADKLAKTVLQEEEITAAVDTVTFQQIIDSEADRRATEASQTAVINYKKRHSLKEGKPVAGDGQGNENEPKGNQVELSEDTPAWARALIENNTELKKINDSLIARLDGLEGDKITTSRKQQLDTIFSETSESFKTRTMRGYERMAFKDDDDFNTYLGQLKQEAEEDVANTRANQVVIRPPFVGQGNPTDQVPKSLKDHYDQSDKGDGQPY